MKNAMKGMIITILFLSIIIFNASPGRTSSAAAEPPPSGGRYRDINGISIEDITALEALRNERDYFSYSVLPSTEAFEVNGEIRGWSALFAEWLTELIGIPFIPRFVEWNEYLAVLATHEIDFTGHMTATEERRKVYHMTTPIAQNVIRTYRLADSLPIEIIAQARLPLYAFVAGTTTIEEVTSQLIPGTYEIVIVEGAEDAYRALKSGEADTFFNTDFIEAAFDVYGDVVAGSFFPTVYSPVSLTTQNPDLIPVINIVQAALDDGALRELTALYNQGYQEYLRYKLSTQFTMRKKHILNPHPRFVFRLNSVIIRSPFIIHTRVNGRESLSISSMKSVCSPALILSVPATVPVNSQQ